jgi:FtsP/CotA-like multicopper oxidase with cupredoxin domain
MRWSRRSFLTGTTSVAIAAAAPRTTRADSARKTLRMETGQIEVHGKAATRYRVVQPTGAFGLTLNEGDEFNVRLENGLTVLAGLHWHGLTEPWRQDGVSYLSGPPIAPGAARDFIFPATPPGTRWMHSHFGLQEQNLLAAPLIIREASAIRSSAQEVVVLLEDFSWTSPEEIFDSLRKRPASGMAAGAMAPMAAAPTMAPTAGPDLNDVDYDAYLANERPLDDPEVIRVERNGEIRLRIINAGASTNFTIDLGNVQGTLVAVDGSPIAPLPVTRFPVAIAQRADIVLRMPPDGTAVPILALGEGRRLRTGVILQPPGATVAKISASTSEMGPQVGLEQELQLRASTPLEAKPANCSIPVDLTGNMMGYTWGMPVNGVAGLPATVDRDERVEIIFRNLTMMSHPMHLHGHVFQVAEVNGKQISGAIRDTMLVPPRATVKVMFDANNPGLWAFHCHNLYHMAAGMFSTLVYRGFA